MNMQTMKAEITRRMKLRERLENDEQLSRDEYVDAKELDWAEIGGELKEERLEHGITLAEMARQTGFSASTLGRFEKGYPVQRANVIERSYRLLFDYNTAIRIAESLSDAYTAETGIDLIEQFIIDHRPDELHGSNIISIEEARAARN